jgi:hypothetical protein
MNAIARKVPGDKHVFDRPATSRNASKQDQRVIDALKAAAMVHCSAARGVAEDARQEARRAPRELGSTTTTSTATTRRRSRRRSGARRSGTCSAFADNWCERVVYASGERLRVQGFRFGGEGQEGDSDAWEIWQRNNLDQGARIAQTEAIKLGTAYLLVDRDDDGKALITTEHPFETICAHAPGNRRQRRRGAEEVGG